MDVQVPCRKCGKKAPSSEFTIDNDLKIAVCKACANERKIARSSSGFNPSVRNTPTELPKPQKATGSSADMLPKKGVRNVPPAGWDETDELLEKAAASKAAASAAESGENLRLADGRVMHVCRKCKYQYKYDAEDDKPNKCPYCTTPSKSVFR